MNAHFQHCAQKPTLESSQCSLWARQCGIQEAIWLYYFTYSFTTKRGVLVFHAVLWRSFLMRARQEGIVPLSQGYFPELCRNCKCLSTPTQCQARVSQKRQWGNQLQQYNFTSSKCNKQLKTWPFYSKCLSFCSCSNVMIQETFCTKSTNPPSAQCPNSHTVWHWHKVLRQEQQFDWPLHFCL